MGAIDSLPSLFIKERWDQFALGKERFAFSLFRSQKICDSDEKERIPSPALNIGHRAGRLRLCAHGASLKDRRVGFSREYCRCTRKKLQNFIAKINYKSRQEVQLQILM